MVPDQLYRTDRTLNEYCCRCFVMTSDKPVAADDGFGHVAVDIDDVMFDAMFQEKHFS